MKTIPMNDKEGNGKISMKDKLRGGPMIVGIFLALSQLNHEERFLWIWGITWVWILADLFIFAT